ncbi:MAG: hypothetical protein QOJ22_943 [Thermoleophilaceae bacterium]|jgi:hypothetical protein|nr:hypothetical protein [Thermoleophilaceae bacterium]
MKREWLVPLTGVLFVVLAFVSIVVGGEPPDAGDPVREIIDHYVDNEDQIYVSAILGGLACVALVFFGSYFRTVLRAAEGPGRGTLSAVVFAGTVIMAIGIAIDMTISVALAGAVDDVEPAAVQALQALWDNDFVPIALGIELFLLSAGLAIVRHGGAPKWLGWVALVLAAAGPTPIGFIAFLGGAIWILIVSIVLALRARKGAGDGAPPAAAPPAPA